jgi:O-antigen ligase
MAVSVSLPIAWISIAKLLLFTFCLAYLLIEWFISPGITARRASDNFQNSWTDLWTIKAVLGVFFVFSVSLLWTDIDLALALTNLVKHGKLLAIIVLVCLIRSPGEARLTLLIFASGQLFLLLGSWMLAAGLPVPWATKDAGKYVVFSSYLDQSIMFGCAAAMAWHLRGEGLWPKWFAGFTCTMFLINALLLLEGRTGYVVALSMMAMGAMWSMPQRLRYLALVATPVLVLAALFVSSTTVKDRVSGAMQRSQHYAATNDSTSSEGWRLNAWRRSLQAIQEKPWTGHGIGSWTATVKRLQGSSAVQTFGTGNASNPHQEYLLWGVELGLMGPFLLAMLLFSLARDARQFRPSIARATWSVVAALGMACLFNSTLYDGLIGDFFCVSLGLLLALGYHCRGTMTGAPA